MKKAFLLVAYYFFVVIATCSQTTKITTVVNITSNTTYSGEALIFETLGKLNIATGIIVTINTKLIVNKGGQIFAITGTGRVIFGYGSADCINPVWFGATPNDATDDTNAFLNCRDAVSNTPSVSNTRGVSKICIPPGLFRCGSIPFFRKNSVADLDYSQITVTIEGATDTYAPNTDPIGAITTIQSTDTNGYVFAFQLARNCLIKNIAFIGVDTIQNFTVKNTVEATDAQWKTFCRDNQYSPNAAIVIDPFHSSVAAPNRYPNSSALYTNTATGGSSMVTITGCTFYKFVVGIMVSPNGTTTNCDNISVSNSHVEACKVFWATGQSQSRDNSITNVYSTGRMKFFMDAVTYGQQTGDLPVISNCNLAGGTRYLFNSSGGWTTIRVNNTHCELLYGLGFGGLASPIPHTFTNSTFHFMGDLAASNIRSNPCVLEATIAAFYGCVVRYYGCGTGRPALNFNVNNLLLSNCTINNMISNSPTNSPGEKLYQVIFQNVFVDCLGGYITNNYEQSGFAPSNLNRRFMIGGTKFSSFAGDAYSTVNKYNIDFTGYNFDFYPVGTSGVITINDVAKECSFTTSTPGIFQPGDIILSDL